MPRTEVGCIQPPSPPPPKQAVGWWLEGSEKVHPPLFEAAAAAAAVIASPTRSMALWWRSFAGGRKEMHVKTSHISSIGASVNRSFKSEKVRRRGKICPLNKFSFN